MIKKNNNIEKRISGIFDKVIFIIELLNLILLIVPIASEIIPKEITETFIKLVPFWFIGVFIIFFIFLFNSLPQLITLIISAVNIKKKNYTLSFILFLSNFFSTLSSLTLVSIFYKDIPYYLYFRIIIDIIMVLICTFNLLVRANDVYVKNLKQDIVKWNNLNEFYVFFTHICVSLLLFVPIIINYSNKAVLLDVEFSFMGPVLRFLELLPAVPLIIGCITSAINVFFQNKILSIMCTAISCVSLLSFIYFSQGYILINYMNLLLTIILITVCAIHSIIKIKSDNSIGG